MSKLKKRAESYRRTEGPTISLTFNKDDNIHKSEALKRYDRLTLTFVEGQN